MPSEWKGHVRSAVVFCFQGHGAAEGASTGDWQGWEAATLCCFLWWHLPACWLASRSGTAADGTAWQTSCSHFAPGAPFAKELVESVTMIPSQRGQPLWVGYAWDVRAFGAQPYACGVCVGLWTWGGSAFVSSGAMKSSILFWRTGFGESQRHRLPGRSSIFMPFCNLVAVSWDF